MSRGRPEQSMSNDSFSDGAPASDFDPYQNQSYTNPITTYNIDTSKLPQPIPILGPLFGFNDDRFAKLFQSRVVTVTQALGRPINQDEANAVAFYTAKGLSILSYGPPIGIAGGLWRCYGTRDTYRWPFIKPPEGFSPDKFPAARFPILTGSRAIIAWHVMRAIPYTIIGNIMGTLFFGSYSTTVTAVGELSDKRLKPFVEAIKEKTKQGQLPRPGQQGQRFPQPQPGQGNTMPIGGMNEQDNASPTGGMFGQADMTPAPGTYENPTTQSAPTRQWPAAKPVPAQASAEESQAKPFDMFDDASPTGGQGMIGDMTPAQSQGSAWERLRRGEKPASRSPNQGQIQTQREQREGSTVGDEYTFSKSDEERSYAKEEAQKEFDARLERERRGGDFNAGGANRKW